MSSLFVPFAFTRLMYFRDIAKYYPEKGYTNAHGIFLVLFILFSACMTDTCAYFAGTLLGKHKLCPSISPKKTVEGAIGGIASSIVFTVVIYYTGTGYQVKVDVLYPMFVLEVIVVYL